MSNYRIGELDQKINIQREVRIPDDMGGHTLNLENIAVCQWAHVRPMSGSEAERFDKLNPVATELFVIRWRGDLQEDDRVIWEGVEYNIRYIKNAGGRKLYLEFFAERGVAQ